MTHEKRPSEGRKQPSPRKYAALLAIPYFILAWVYILVTSSAAAAFAVDQEHLAEIEIIKGSAFIFLSAVFIYLLAMKLFERVLRQRAELSKASTALALMENRAVAGVFASSVAHDMNNIMMGLYNDVLEYAAREDLTPQERERAQRLSFAAKEMMAMARKLASTGRSGPPGTPETVDLSACLREIVAFARHHRSVRHCEIEEQIDAVPTIDAIPVILRQVFLNLILNAAEATAGYGKIRIVCRQEPGRTVVEVHDNGQGIPEDKRDLVFDPFHTTKASGSGLGLHSVKSGTELHGGTIEIATSPLGGALIRVVIPFGSGEFLRAGMDGLAPGNH